MKRASLRTIGGLQGFVASYLLCGPFNKDNSLTSCQALDRDYLSSGEHRSRPRAGLIENDSDGSEVKWIPYTVRHGFSVNLIAMFTGEAMINYAAAYIYCPRPVKGKICIGSDDGFKLYLNGRLVSHHHVHRGLGLDNDIANVDFKRGVNPLLMKIEHNFGGHEFCLRITDTQGNAIKGMSVLTNPPDVKEAVITSRIETVSAYEYISHKFATAAPALPFAAKTGRQYSVWRKKFLSVLADLLDESELSHPVRSTVVKEEEIEIFCRQKILIEFEPGFNIPCYVTKPRAIKKGKTLPAILCLHGHGNGKADMVGLSLGTALENPWSANYAMALHAARRGYVTISPDFLAFGERGAIGSPYGLGQDPCASQFAWLLSVGIVPTAVNLQTVRRCIDYLLTLNCVDGRRIAAMGHSFGGYMTAMATALEPRISAAVISGFLCTAQGYHGKPWHCGSQVVPGLFRYGDISDVACTLAPRPLLVITGLYDCVTPAPFAKAAFKKIKKAYGLARAKDKLDQFTFEGDHIFQPKEALAWLDRWLCRTPGG